MSTKNKKDEIKKETPVEETSTEAKAKEKAEEKTEEKAEEKAENIIAELNAKIEQLEAEAKDAKEQMLRHQAELENYRKRLTREKEEAVLYANAKLVEDILPFLDNLDRSVLAIKAEATQALADGVQMVEDQIMGTLDKNWGLKQIETVGKEFDPMLHEACMATVDESLEVETVIAEFQKGYTLHGRVVRPAKVQIAKPE